MDKPNGIHYIDLSSNFIRFDAVSQLTNVFFDDSNKQVNILISHTQIASHLLLFLP